jgi:hypothetical protein
MKCRYCHKQLALDPATRAYYSVELLDLNNGTAFICDQSVTGHTP